MTFLTTAKGHNPGLIFAAAAALLSSTFHTDDRKGLKQTSFLNDSGKHFFADIVYSQNFFVFEEKKDD